VQVAGESFHVNGTSWLDREWSTSALGEDQVGWDWFSLQLDDQRELMYYQLRLRDGRPDPMSSGVLVGAAGATRRLKPEDIEISVLEHWQSETSGAKYPAKWRIDLLEEKLSLEISPLVSDQELQTTIRYWEGAVAVQGKQENTQVTGHGYVEMTGY
jgi:predicted secreted hydrolase